MFANLLKKKSERQLTGCYDIKKNVITLRIRTCKRKKKENEKYRGVTKYMEVILEHCSSHNKTMKKIR